MPKKIRHSASDGTVIRWWCTQSHYTSLWFLELAKRQGLSKVYVHCFLDGRDTPPASGKDYVEQLEAKMKEIGVGKIATVSGRYYAMDRDNRLGPCRKSLRAFALGEGDTAASCIQKESRLLMSKK